MVEEITFPEYCSRIQQRCTRSQIIAADTPYVCIERDEMGISISVHTSGDEEEYLIEYVREGASMTPEGGLLEAYRIAQTRNVGFVVVSGVFDPARS